MSKIIELYTETMHGKTLTRTLFNWHIRRTLSACSGDVLDLGAGFDASYRRYLPDGLHITATDLHSSREDILSVDLNQPLPFGDETFQTIFLFNTVYILEDRIKTLREIHRVLKKGGHLYLSSPFLVNEIPEPHDYCRLTAEGLEKELKASGFTYIETERIGGRATAAVTLLRPFLMFNFLRFLTYVFALWVDRKTKKKDTQHPAPILYFCTVAK